MLDRTSQKPRRLSKTTEAILDQWAKGRAGVLIGKDLGICPSTVFGRVWNARKRGDPRAAVRPTTEGTVKRLNYAAIREKWVEGWSSRDIADFFGCSESGVRHIVRYQVDEGFANARAPFMPVGDAAFWIREARKRNVSPTELKRRALKVCEEGLLGAILDDGA